MKNVLIIGVSGVTCGGKTTTATYLNNILPGSKIFSQDDYFLPVDDPRHTVIGELNHINFDILSSLDNAQMHLDILDYVEKQNITNDSTVKHDFSNGIEDDLQKTVSRLIRQLNLKVVIVEGFCIFNYKPMQDIFDLKYYFTLEEEECYKRRITRVYEPPDCPGYFEACVWPEHLKLKEEVQSTLEDVTYFVEKFDINSVIKMILLDLKKLILNKSAKQKIW